MAATLLQRARDLGGQAVGLLGANAHGVVTAFHGANSGPDTRNDGTDAERGVTRKTRGNAASARDRLFDRLTRTFLWRRLRTEKPAGHLAGILGISYRQALDLMNGSARWTRQHILALLLHFPDYLHGVLARMAGSAALARPRFRRRRKAGAA